MNEDFLSSTILNNVLVDLETQRKKIASTKVKSWCIIVFGVIILLAIVALGQPIIGFIAGIAAIITGCVMLYQISSVVVAYKNKFKHDVVGVALSTINQTLTISPDDGILELEFALSQLFTVKPDRYHTEDLICGTANKTTFCFAEVHAEYKTETQTKNGRKEHWHDILKGIIFIADFNKNFNGVTVVRAKDIGKSIAAWFSKNVFSASDKDIITLENTDFNANFITYATNQVEARYILTPALMDKINVLNNRCTSTISLSFVNSKMYIAFPLAKNYFEPPIFKTLLQPNLLVEDLAVLNFMYGIINELDLNTRIWTKQ